MEDYGFVTDFINVTTIISDKIFISYINRLFQINDKIITKEAGFTSNFPLEKIPFS